MLLSFSANTLDQATLEKTLVGRKEVVDRVEQELLEKALLGQTYQSLLIAPRGSGKTHITKLLHYRLKNNLDLVDKIFVAYMNEDERGIANFSDFIRHILLSFVKHQEGKYDILMDLIYEVSGLPVKQQETAFVNILLEFIGEKGLVILVENLNVLFDKKTGMGLDGQNKLRSLMHEHNQFSILATSQNLFYQIQDAKAPFYQFFNIEHLEKLSFEQAFELVKIQASLEKNEELTRELIKPIFKGKVRAIYALTGGNHRLLVIFFNFLKVDFKSNLSEIFVKTMNDLKPYYEQFINALSPQQQKIIQFLSSNHTPKMGKEISRFCFIAPNTLSKQTAELVEKGLLGKNKKGKDIYYELREPLMRICFEINEADGGIAKLFIDFLTALYSEEDLQKQYLRFKFGALLQQDNSKKTYEKEAKFYKKSLPSKTLKVLDNLSLPKFQNENELNQTIEDILFDLKMKNEQLDTKQKAALESLERRFGKRLLNRILKEGVEKNKDVHFDLAFFEKLTTNEMFKKNKYLFQHLALLYFNNNDYSKAIKYREKSIELDPLNIINYISIAEIYLYIKKNYKKSIKFFSKALEINPEIDSIYIKKGKAHLFEKEHDQAMNAFDNALRINPINSEAYFNKGSVFEEQEEYEEAIKYYALAIEKDSTNSWYYFRLGYLYFQREKYANASDFFNTAISINSEKAIFHLLLGNTFERLKKYEEAVISYKKGIELNPEDSDYYSDLAGVYDKLERYEDAIIFYKKAIELNPEDSDYYSDLADVYTKLAMYEDAIIFYKKAIELNPEDSDYYSDLADVYAKLTMYEDAIIFYKKAIVVSPNEENIYISLGNTYYTQKKYNKAIIHYRKVIDINPVNTTAYSNLGRTYLNIGKYQVALGSYNKAIKLDPQDSENYFEKSKIFFILKEYEEAIYACSKAIEKSPKNQNYYFVLGMIYLENNNHPKALTILKRGLKIDSKHWYLNLGISSYYLSTNNLEQSKIQFEKAFQLSEMDSSKLSFLFYTGNLYPLFKNVEFEKMKIYLHFLISTLKEKQLLSEFWNAFTPTFFNILINIEDYPEPRLTKLNTYLQETFKPYKEMIIPLLYLNIGIHYLKKGEERAIYDLSKEERQIFQEFVLDKRAAKLEI